MSSTDRRFSKAHLMRHFPYEEIRPNQNEMFEAIAEHGSVLIQGPTGSGKSAVEYSVLKAAQSIGMRPLFLLTPNKTVLTQIAREFPDLTIAMGRNEHPCFYYEEDKSRLHPDMKPEEVQYRADEIPCSLLLNCPHRVDQETGRLFDDSVVACPYLKQKFEAKHSKGIVICTMAFYLFTHLWKKEGEDDVSVLVIDEVHQWPKVVRNALTSEVTDYHISKAIELLKAIGADAEAEGLNRFLKKMVQIIKRRPAVTREILKEDEKLNSRIGGSAKAKRGPCVSIA